MRPPLHRTAFAQLSHTPAWLGGLLLCGLGLGFIVLGHDGQRVAQLLVLLLPLLAMFSLRVRSPLTQGLRALGMWLWVMLFVFDGVARGYLQDTYQAAPNSSLVLAAAANTNVRESGEYLLSQWRTMLLWSLSFAMAGIAAWLAVWHMGRHKPSQRQRSRWLQILMVVVLLLVVLAYSSKPWRRLHPIAFWGSWVGSVHTLRKDWANQTDEREQHIANAKALAPVFTGTGPSTMVLVISDSVNRDNMSLYGYARNTTPQLQTLQRDAGKQMLVLRNAWSVEASTIPALHRMFNFDAIPGSPEPHSQQHFLAMAREAGYKIWWVSNHDDLAIEQQHAQLADVVQLINRTPGRSTQSLDEELLDEFDAALAAPDERKLIVVQLLGAHPHYRLRFPDDANPFDDHVDSVDEQLTAQGRPAWVRSLRHEYDAALLYHDGVISSLLRATQANASGNESQATTWLYLSDHGQEVGHNVNHAGHSQSTAAGFRVPTIIWRNAPIADADGELARQPFRTDWLAPTLADLMQLDWQGRQPAQNVLAPQYQWHAPQLPVTVNSFIQ